MRKAYLGAALLLATAAHPAWSQGGPSPNTIQGEQLNDEWLARMVGVSDLGGPGEAGNQWFPGGYFAGTPPRGQNDPRYSAGSPFDGVARLLINESDGTYGCTGSLLWTGRDILTAAHCVYDFTTGKVVDGKDITLTFLNTEAGTSVNLKGTKVIMKEGYTGDVIDYNDLAIIRLQKAADDWIPRYSLYNGNPMWQETMFVGYGLTGNGVTGGVVNTLFDETPVRRVGWNRFETNLTDDGYLTINLDGSPVTPLLLSDFDGADPGGRFPVRGTWAARTLAQNNTVCNWWAGTAGIPADLRANLCHTGYGLYEGMIGSGDSGGPAFIDANGKLRIAGVASFGSQRCVPSQHTPARTSPGCPAGYLVNGSYFGSYGGHVSVAYGDGYDWVKSTVTPEPVSMTLLGTGLAGLAAVRRRRKQADAEA